MTDFLPVNIFSDTMTLISCSHFLDKSWNFSVFHKFVASCVVPFSHSSWSIEKILFLISQIKNMLRVVIRSTSVRCLDEYHNSCFCREIRKKISTSFV